MSNIHTHRILILDFGSQYTQLIARRVREAGVYSEIMSYDADILRIKKFSPKCIILSGGPASVVANLSPQPSREIFQLATPVLGICYGMQVMVKLLGGEVEQTSNREFGYAQVAVQAESKLLQNIEDHASTDGKSLLDVWMSHGDRVNQLPPEFICIASSESAPLAAMANEKRGYYGLQFHPEVTHTQQGLRILQHYVRNICTCDGSWTSGNIIEDSFHTIREQVGDSKVLLGLSGGVDSSVVAALLHKSIGKQLTCVFVDNGLLRQEEGRQVRATFEQHMGVKVISVNAQDRFLGALKKIVDPEQKRKIIGKLFIEIFEEEAKKLTGVSWLAQGTIYPDVIESAGAGNKNAHVIKSHHNVGGLPEHMQLKLLEPLRELFKDEVRKIGLDLGLPHEMVYRHPFPGPGLAVRILGEVTQEYTDILRQVDAIFIDELRAHELYDKVSQAFAVFLPIRSVGVKGDGRVYEFVVSLRAVETIDFMTAHWARLPYAFLEHVSRRILNEVARVSRVTYDISQKPPATIEWE